ncbi:MAG: 50S ribosome-binding GTPase, partial [Candidatus Aenigmarchaeota archaeon]|nr:50S ribosome-binding GTPase [Candidatus Aenigmarchaeota archaeon]
RWAKKKILTVKRITLKGYTKLKPNLAIQKRKVFYGRLNSVLRGIESDLDFLRDCCKAIANLPIVKEMPTVIIAGFPNAGKSSLLKAITGSEPDIQPYPFTTKGLMMGYTKIGYHKIQFIDTPGLLDRPLEKSNNIEKRAIAALRHLGGTIIFVIDPLYNVEGQLKLLEDVKSELKSKVIIAINKCDLEFDKEEVAAKVSGLMISATEGTGIDALIAAVGESIKQ